MLVHSDKIFISLFKFAFNLLQINDRYISKLNLKRL